MPGEKETAGRITKVCTAILELPPSCVEFSPKWPDYFMIGTYNLEKDNEDEDKSGGQDAKGNGSSRGMKPQSRNGTLILGRLLNDDLVLIHRVTYPSAVLDLHFSPHLPNLFAVASSSGGVSLFELQETPGYALVHLHTYQNFPTSTLVLSLAWHPSFPDLIGVSLSSGTIALLQFSHDRSTLTTLQEGINPHSGLEAWTLAFSPTHHSKQNAVAQGIYSGGDDSRLRCITFGSLVDLSRSPQELAKLSPGGLVGMTGHNAGVTAILPLPIHTDAGQDILLTGSYDDYVRVYATYDHRPGHSNTPKALAELRIGGGVWRLKFLRDYTSINQARRAELQGGEDSTCVFRVLASCMHVGARILEVTGSKHGNWTIKLLAAFEEHASMNYGSDVRPEFDAEGNDREALCISTSFYDKLLCVWRFQSE